MNNEQLRKWAKTLQPHTLNWFLVPYHAQAAAWKLKDARSSLEVFYFSEPLYERCRQACIEELERQKIQQTWA